MKNFFLVSIVFFLWDAALYSCRRKETNVPVKKHLFEASTKKKGRISVDSVSNHTMLENETTDGEDSTDFYSFRISIEDSTVNGHSDVELNKYFQYQMQKDWVLLLKGDTIPAVFFHPVQNLNSFIREAVVVFELPHNEAADTLIYNDSYGTWGSQLILLNKKIK